MPSDAQVYAEAVIAVALTATIGIISAFITAAFTGDRALSIGGGLIMLGLTGAVCLARLWRLTHPINGDVPSPDASMSES